MFDKSFEQEALSITSSNAPRISVVLITYRNIHLGSHSTELKEEAKIGKGANGNTNLEAEVVDATTVPKAGIRVAFMNNTLYSLFSNCDVIINNQNAQNTSKNLYSHRLVSKQNCPILRAVQLEN